MKLKNQNNIQQINLLVFLFQTFFFVLFWKLCIIRILGLDESKMGF